MRLLWVFFLVALDMCPWEHSTATPLTSTLKLSANVTGHNEINTMNNSFNGIDATSRVVRQPKFFGFFGQPVETKEFKTGYELNPAVVDRLSAFVSFGKSHVQTLPCEEDTDSGNSAATAAASSSSSSSTTTFTSSSASASASSSSSASISSSSTTATAAATAVDDANSSASAASNALPSSASISASETELPTNEQYYPIANSETQTNNDIDQQHYDKHQNGAHDIFGKFEKQKKTWTQFINAPAHALQKMRKNYADAIGFGPLYGTDHFAPRKIHRVKVANV